MSYILDALKKAERERNLSEIPTLDTIHEVRPDRGSRAWIIAAVIFVASALVLAIWLWQPEPETQPVASLQQSETQAPAQQSVAPVAKAAPEAITPRSEHEILSRTAPETTNARPEPDTAQEIPPVRDIPSRPSGRAVNAPQEPVAEKVSSPARPAPAPLRDAAGTMKITIHIYADAKEERMVFINGRKYLEGDYVEGSYLLESITPEGAVLSHDGERIVISPPAR